MWLGSQTRARLEKLEDDFLALRLAHEALERQPKLLRNEWEDTLDRMNRVMGRLTARIKAAATSDPTGDEVPPADGLPPPPPQPTGHHERMQLKRARRF